MTVLTKLMTTSWITLNKMDRAVLYDLILATYVVQRSNSVIVAGDTGFASVFDYPNWRWSIVRETRLTRGLMEAVVAHVMQINNKGITGCIEVIWDEIESRLMQSQETLMLMTMMFFLPVTGSWMNNTIRSMNVPTRSIQWCRRTMNVRTWLRQFNRGEPWVTIFIPNLCTLMLLPISKRLLLLAACTPITSPHVDLELHVNLV